MEKMINEYLDFASNQYSQPVEKFNIVQLIQNLIDKSFKKNIKIKTPKNLIFSGRKNLIRRCIANIINNSQKYARGAGGASPPRRERCNRDANSQEWPPRICQASGRCI